MSQRIEAVVEALTDLLARHGRSVVTDPAQMPALLAQRLGNAPRDNALLRAVVAASHTAALREFAPGEDIEASFGALESAIATLGLPAEDATDGARAWTEALRTVDDPTVAGAPDGSEQDPPADQPVEQDREPDFFENDATVETAAPAAEATAAAILVPPVPPPSIDPFVVDTPGPPPASPYRQPDTASSWPTKAKASCALAALVALILGIVAFVGWNRDPSKEEAESARRQVSELQAELDTADASTEAAEDATAAAQATIAERDAALAEATGQVDATREVSKTQYDNARWPETFTLSGTVAAGSCSLSPAACEKTAVVRDIVVSCAGDGCGCVDGGCTVTSELWQTAAPVTYDASTGLFTAAGMLDGDQFTCGGVPQATAFSFRFRATKIAYDTGWVAAEIAAELSETSEATDACLAGGRTYALNGPSVG